MKHLVYRLKLAYTITNPAGNVAFIHGSWFKASHWLVHLEPV